VNLLFEGDLVALFVMITILVDTFRHRLLTETFKDGLFRRIGVAGLVTIMMGISRAVCSTSNSNCPPWAIRTFGNLHAICLLVTLFLWLMFVLENLFEGHRNIKRIGVYTAIVIVLLTIASIADIPKDGLFSIRTKRTILAVLTVLWGIGVLVPVLCKWKHLLASTRRSLTFIPVILTSSIISYAIFGNHLLVSTAISIAVLTTYLIIQNRRFSIDQLTGVLTRGAFINKLRKLFYGTARGTVLIADIENFKYFNQKFGQHNGDLLLKAVGNFFGRVAYDKTVYRYGGDQFGLILREVEEEDIQRTLRTIRQRFDEPWEIGGANARTDIRLALVPFPGQLQSAEEMINAIDLTLVKAKSHNTLAVARYTREISAIHQRKRDVEHAIRVAIETDSVQVLYQPIFETQTCNIYSAEALARIDDPTLGDISPTEFIPIAETSGLIIDLTYMILRKVCLLWKQLEDNPSHLSRIAINLSAINFLEPSMEKHLLEVIREYGVSPRNIKFELTESVIVESFDRVKEAMDHMAANGISFSLDDYGKGYSNLEYLVNLPFSTVKVDKSIVQACQKNYTLIESIMLMLSSMGKKIVAEGVETEQQLALLSEAGATRVQGFLFAKPMSGSDLIDYIKQRKGIDP
jgi:diguanylate cyclase (GGDEF)-like protein